jgi:hypothetical protein
MARAAPGAVARRCGHVHGITREAAAGDLDQRCRAAAAGVLLRLDHQHRRALADREPVAAGVERAHCVGSRRTQAVEARDDEVAENLRAAGDQDVGVAAAGSARARARRRASPTHRRSTG